MQIDQFANVSGHSQASGGSVAAPLLRCVLLGRDFHAVRMVSIMWTAHGLVVESLVCALSGGGFLRGQVQRLGRSGPAGAAVDTSRWLYRTNWQSQPLVSGDGRRASGSGAWLVLADKRGVGVELANDLAARGEASVLVEPAKEFKFQSGAAANGNDTSSAHTAALWLTAGAVV